MSSAQLTPNFYFYALNQHLPAWASLEHPVVKRELGVWRTLTPRFEKMWSTIWFWFLFAPLVISTFSGAITLIGAFYNPRGALPFLASLWLLQLFPSWGIKMFAALGASFIITRERETLNWTLLRLTPLSVQNILGAKVAGLLHWLTEPLLMLIGLRAIAAVGTAVMIMALTQQGATTGFGIALRLDPKTILSSLALSFFIFTFSFIEIATSLLYNCSVGLLSSALARTSTTAMTITFTMQLILWLFIFLPLQRLYTPALLAFAQNFFNPAVMETIVPVALSLFIPVFVEASLAWLAFRLALQRAQRLVE